MQMGKKDRGDIGTGRLPEADDHIKGLDSGGTGEGYINLAKFGHLGNW